jgi:hypothetical protein
MQRTMMIHGKQAVGYLRRAREQRPCSYSSLTMDGLETLDAGVGSTAPKKDDSMDDLFDDLGLGDAPQGNSRALYTPSQTPIT